MIIGSPSAAKAAEYCVLGDQRRDLRLTTWKERPIMRKLRMMRQAWSYPQVEEKRKDRPNDSRSGFKPEEIMASGFVARRRDAERWALFHCVGWAGERFLVERVADFGFVRDSVLAPASADSSK